MSEANSPTPKNAADWRSLYPFKSNWLETPAGKLHYVDEGQGRAVLMLHGNPSWSFLYRDVVKALRPTARCVVPDHIGCGLSDKPQDWPYRLAGHIENVERLVSHLRLRELDLIVHDWGGAIGCGFAVRNPGLVRRIVVLNTAAFRSRHIPLRIALCKVPGLGTLLIRGFNGFAWPATFMSVTKPLAPAVKAGFLHPYGNWRDRIATLRFVQDIPLHDGHPSYKTLTEIEKGLPRLADKPLLVCWGGRDFCFNHHFLSRWRELFPAAQVREWPEAGHYALEDAGSEIIPSIAAFLGR